MVKIFKCVSRMFSELILMFFSWSKSQQHLWDGFHSEVSRSFSETITFLILCSLRYTNANNIWNHCKAM